MQGTFPHKKEEELVVGQNAKEEEKRRRVYCKAEEAPPEVLEAARLSAAAHGKWHGGLGEI